MTASACARDAVCERTAAPVLVDGRHGGDHRRGHELQPEVVGVLTQLVAQIVGGCGGDDVAELRLPRALVAQQVLVVADDLPAHARRLVDRAQVLDHEVAQRVERRDARRPSRQRRGEPAAEDRRGR